MGQITVSNHFVPQAYLRNWSLDGKRVSTRALLVPHENFPEWRFCSIRSRAARDHLYTSIRDGREADLFERWMNIEIEQPADEALKKVASDAPLTRSELVALIRYTAALDKRTPTSFLEQKANWEEWLPDIMKRTLNKLPGRLARRRRTSTSPEPAPPQDQPEQLFPLPLRVGIRESTEPGLVEVRPEISSGRELWLHSLHRTLTQTYNTLLKHNWSILRPSSGEEWFTSDHPVVRLAYISPSNYHFRGGWAQKGAELLLPLSPHHLLYTKIGERFPAELQLDRLYTFRLQRFIAERASREIYATRPTRRTSWFRPRVVSPERYKEEREAWEQFHTLQGGRETRSGGESR